MNLYQFRKAIHAFESTYKNEFKIRQAKKIKFSCVTKT